MGSTCVSNGGRFDLPPNFEDFDGRDSRGQTALHIAATHNFREIGDLILDCEQFTAAGAKDADGMTALHYAAFFGDDRMCRSILKNKHFTRKNAAAKDKQGGTALSYAVHCGHEESAK